MEYKVINLWGKYNLKLGESYNLILKEDTPFKLLNKNSVKIYEHIFNFFPRTLDVKNGEKEFIVTFELKGDFRRFEIEKIGFNAKLGNTLYDISKIGTNKYIVKIPYDNISLKGNTSILKLYYSDNNGYYYLESFYFANQHKIFGRRYLFSSKLVKSTDRVTYGFETMSGLTKFGYRKQNRTDSRLEYIKIFLAMIFYKILRKLKKNKPSIVLYEKFSSEYEESASVVFEKLIDEGNKNVYFILDKKSRFYNRVPEKYKPFIVNRFSLKHYYEYFNAKAFISTETLAHCNEIATRNQFLTKRANRKGYYFIFLQHGVMYMYALKGRTAFLKWKSSSFGGNSFIVVSSEKEAQHFIEQGGFESKDLIKSGIPKFDFSKQNNDADKILVMPTSRNFEYAVIRDNPRASTYYKFVKRILMNIPENLQTKIIFAPHPLVAEYFKDTDLADYMPKELDYNSLLMETKLLITDYSSIAYDGFYRGCHVIFDWTDKDMCLEKLGYDLMLNNENVFADVINGDDEYGKIEEAYYGEPTCDNIKKFREIVEFNDNKNTERLMRFLEKTYIFNDTSNKRSIKDVKISGIEEYYLESGKPIKPKHLVISLEGMKLVQGIDYRLSYAKNISSGIGEIEVKGIGNFYGIKKFKFNIYPSISNIKVIGDKFILGNRNLELNKDYIIKENEVLTDLGIRNMVIEGINDLRGRYRIISKI